MSGHQIWDVEKVQAFVADQEEAATFFCGSLRNFAQFIDLFDRVFVLEVDLDTMNRRIDERVALDPTGLGGKPEENRIHCAIVCNERRCPEGWRRISMPLRRLNASWMRFWKSAARSPTRAERPAEIQTETLPSGRVPRAHWSPFLPADIDRSDLVQTNRRCRSSRCERTLEFLLGRPVTLAAARGT